MVKSPIVNVSYTSTEFKCQMSLFECIIANTEIDSDFSPMRFSKSAQNTK